MQYINHTMSSVQYRPITTSYICLALKAGHNCLGLASVVIGLKELGGGWSAAEMFEILPRDWNLKPIFTQKWASVDMNWGVQPPDNIIPTLGLALVNWVAYLASLSDINEFRNLIGLQNFP